MKPSILQPQEPNNPSTMNISHPIPAKVVIINLSILSLLFDQSFMILKSIQTKTCNVGILNHFQVIQLPGKK